MKKLFFLAVAAIILISCSEEPLPENIVLASDKVTAVSDGKDAITFTVTATGNKDVTKEAVISVNDKPLVGTVFRSSEPGTFKVVAAYKNVKSQPIEVKFEEPVPQSITLAADKTAAVADGKDVVTFKVTVPGGADISKEAQIQLNGKAITGNTYTSPDAGILKFTAVYKNVSSNIVEVKFENPVNTALKIEFSKAALVADGADRVTFSCVNTVTPDTDINGETVFYVNGEAIQGKVFKTKTAGVYKVQAKYNKQLSPEFALTAQTEFVATAKIYAELFAATWCPFCPAGMFFIEAAGNNSKIVPITVHPRNSLTSTDPFYVPEGAPLYGYLGVTSIPTLVMNRDKTKLITGSNTILALNPAEVVNKYLNPLAKAGVAIESKLEADRIDAKIYITASENMGDVKVVVMLAENKLVYDQRNNVKPELGDPIKGFEHNHVYRASYNDIFGEEISLTAKTPLEKVVSIPLKPEWKKENCELIVLITNNDNTVINVQKVKAGQEIGY